MYLYRLLPYLLISFLLHFTTIATFKYYSNHSKKTPTTSDNNKIIINFDNTIKNPSAKLESVKKPDQPIKNSVQNQVTEKKYYSFFDVDEPATPLGDWVINTDIWPIGELSTISVTIWISETGEIEDWSVMSQSDPELIELAFIDIKRTVINPAIRNGKKVASVRTLEFVIDRTFFNP